MKEINLFRAQDGTWISNRSILDALTKVKAYDCGILFMHTELSFGIPNSSLSRQELLATIYETITELGIRTICVPAFTFSFCNGKNYDVIQTGSKMGALNEYMRQLDGATRSIDPLMSVAAIGKDKDLVENIGHCSIGTDSTFDKLHHRTAVKFLFFGTSLSKCFTYTHYVEEREQVPYRYNREFTGTITNGANSYQDTFTLFVRYCNVIPSGDGKLERSLLKTGDLLKVPCGDSFLSCIDEPIAYQTIVTLLHANIDCFLETPYPRAGLDKTFVVHNMVAL